MDNKSNTFEPLFPEVVDRPQFEEEVSQKKMHAQIKQNYIVFNDEQSEMVEAETAEEAATKSAIKGVVRIKLHVEKEIS